MACLDLLIQRFTFRLQGGRFPEEMTKHAPLMGPSPVLPEIDRLPGAKHKLTSINAEAEGLGGERCADVGRHVIGPFVGMAIAARFGNDVGHPVGEILQNAGVCVFIDREAATCMLRV